MPGVKVITERLENLRSVTMAIATRRGGCQDEKPGLTSVTLPVLFRGTTVHPDEEMLNLLIDGRGIDTFQFVQDDFSMLGMRCLPEHALDAMELLLEMLEKPLVDEQVLEAEKSSQVQKVQRLMDAPVSRLIYFTARKAVFGENHPLSRPLVGYPETIMRVTREDVLGLVCGSLIVEPACIIVGNVGEDLAGELAGGIGRWLEARSRGEGLDHGAPLGTPASSSSSRSSSPRPAPHGLAVVDPDPSVENAYISVNLRLDGGPIDNVMFRFLAAAIGETFGSRMFRVIRDEKGLSYMTFAARGFAGEHGYLHCVMDVDPGRLDEGICTLVNIIKEIGKHEMDKEEFEMNKEYVLGKLDLALDSGDILAFTLANGLYHGGPTNVQELYRMANSIDAASFMEWCRHVLDPGSLSIAAGGNCKAEMVEKSWKKAILQAEGGVP